MAALWLSCQAAAFGVSPYVLCHDHAMSQMAGHECTRLQRDQGQSAEDASHQHLHHTAELPPATSTDAAIDCRCSVSDAALAAITPDAGVLPREVALETRFAATRVVLSDDATSGRVHPLDPPPPRV